MNGFRNRIRSRFSVPGASRTNGMMTKRNNDYFADWFATRRLNTDSRVILVVPPILNVSSSPFLIQFLIVLGSTSRNSATVRIFRLGLLGSSSIDCLSFLFDVDNIHMHPKIDCNCGIKF